MTIELTPGKYVRKAIKISDEFALYNYFIQILCVMENTYLSSSERSLLIFYILSGVNKETEEKYIKEFGRTKQAVSNAKYRLLQKGFLSKLEESGGHEVVRALKTKRNSLTIVIDLEK